MMIQNGMNAKNYLLTAKRSWYDIEAALEKGLDIVWPQDQVLQKGDVVYIKAVGSKEVSQILCKATLGISQTYDSAKDVPGYAEGVWDKNWLKEKLDLEAPENNTFRNWWKLENIELSTTDFSIEDGEFQRIVPLSSRRNRIELSEANVEQLERHFIPTEEIARVYREMFDRKNEEAIAKGQ